MDRLGPLRALAAPARAGDQVAAAEAEQQGDADEDVLDHDSPSFRPRWATIRTSTPGGVARISALRQRLAQARQAARRLRLADHDVGGAALADDPRDRGDEVVVLLDQQRRAEHRGELAQRRHLALLLPLDRLAPAASPRAGRGRCRAAGPSARRGAPGAGSSAAGGPGRAGARRPPSARRPRPRSSRVPSGSTWLQGQPLGLDVLGHLAQADLAQRGQVLDPEEVVERRLDVLAGVDLAGAQAGDQRLRGEVDEDDLVGGAEHRVGHRLAHPSPRSARRPGR